MQTFGINETKRSGAAHAAKSCIPNFGRRSAPKMSIFAATKPNPLCAARQTSTRPRPFERVANEVDNNVSVINTATNMVVATVPMGDDPQGWPSRLTANKPVTLRTLATPDALGLKTLNELARRLGLEIWVYRESVTRLAKATRPVRFGYACPSWQRRISTDCAPSPVISSTPGRRYREELPAR